jgi:hypothetical protein
MADRKLVKAKESFGPAGYGVISPGDLYWSDDPLVKAHPHLFEDPKVKSSVPQRPATTVGAVETTTAAPGEKRRLTRPAKSAGEPAKEG